MKCSLGLFSLGLAAVAIVAIPARSSQAEVFQFAFTGEVTSVENQNGFFTAAATVGAPVSGMFTHEDPSHDGTDVFNPFVTFYLNDRAVNAGTDLVVRIGGVEASASALSLTNVAVGNGNDDPLPPFFPAGDFYRYLDELDSSSPLFDFSGAGLQQFPFANIVLADSTGTAFGSQALPHELPLQAFDQADGIILLTDENSDFTGRLEFRIDSLQAIPEPATAVLLLVGCLVIAGIVRRNA